MGSTWAHHADALAVRHARAEVKVQRERPGGSRTDELRSAAGMSGGPFSGRSPRGGRGGGWVGGYCFSQSEVSSCLA